MAMELWRRGRSATVGGKRTALRPAAGLRGQNILLHSCLAPSDPPLCAVPAKARAVPENVTTTGETSAGTTTAAGRTVIVTAGGSTVLRVL